MFGMKSGDNDITLVVPDTITPAVELAVACPLQYCP